MKLTFIFPQQAFKKSNPKFCSWFGIEPPTIAKLKSLVPNDIECNFFDERFENINFEKATDLVVITINTFTAYRGYKIAEYYRNMKIPVVIGGLHATLCPDEAAKYGDSIIIGEAEGSFTSMLEDFKVGNLKKNYCCKERSNLKNVYLDRSIFKGKKYMPIRHIEISRGCNFACKFCTITKVYNQKTTLRPIDEIIEDLKTIGTKFVAFIDENASFDFEYRKELYSKMIPLKKKWTAQMTVKSLLNEELVELMAKSGCFNVFIGMETIHPDILNDMNKNHNSIEDYQKAYNNCIKYDIPVSVGIIVGYEGDTIQKAEEVFKYINKHQHFMAIFTTFFPYPSTPIYEEMKKNQQLLNNEWWMTDKHPFLAPIVKYNNEDFTGLAYNYMRKYLTLKNIFLRFINSKYSLKTRLFILGFNLFMKYNFHAFG